MAKYCVPERDRVALITLSAQKDFVQDGSPVRALDWKRATGAMGRLIEGFRERGAPIFHAVRLYRPDGSNVDTCRRQAVEDGLRILMPGSLGAELIEDLRPQPCVRLNPECLLGGRVQRLGPEEWAFYRPRWGAFYGSTLETELRARGISTLVLCGLTFSTGIRATVYEASARDFRTVVVPDALGSSPDETSVQELARIGVYLMTSDNCVHWLVGNDPSCAA
ncbi:MAG: cysteine hydrolase family protein [Kiloniellaceae bacterium]